MATNTWRLAVALGLFFLQGCTPITRYRSDTDPPHRTAPTPRVSIVTMEFDEGGELFERQAQIDLLVKALQPDRHAGRPLITVIFVHGWKNNADPRERDKNYEEFRDFLEHLATDRQVVQEGQLITPSVVGVYVGWRGRLFQRQLALLEVSTFWSRKGAASRVAGAGPAEVFYKACHLAKRVPQSECIVIGHSFGGLIVERSLGPALEGAVLRDAYGLAPEDEPGSQCNPVNIRRIVNLPFDLIVTINAANEGVHVKRFQTLLRHLAFKGCLADWRKPFIVNLTSKSDSATKRAFPLGRWLGTGILPRGYCGNSVSTDPDSLCQRSLFTRTAGHNPRLITHDLEYEGVKLVKVGEEAESSVSLCTEPAVSVPVSDDRGALTDQPLCFERLVQGPGRPPSTERFTIRLRSGSSPTPYWVVSVDSDVIPNHTEIWTNQLVGVLRGLTKSLREFSQ